MMEHSNELDLPLGLDPNQHPVIAQHFFGWRPIGQITSEIVDRLAPRRTVDDDDRDAAA